MAITLNGTTGIASTGAYSSDGISFADNTPADTLVTTTGGNVGIGTSSPSQKLHVVSTTNAQGILVSGSVDNVGLNLSNTGTSGKTWSLLSANTNSGAGGGALGFFDGTAYRMILDSSGNLLVGRTTQIDFGKLCLNYSGATNNGIIFDDTTSSGTTSACIFKRATTNVGAINTTASATSYVTSSDYRLKENIAPMTGALAKVALLKPVTYTWKADGSDGQGFIAHELQEVVPDCVVGEKDAVNEDGSIKAQGIDTSFLVATLTAAIQEQQAIITDLKARIETLENK